MNELAAAADGVQIGTGEAVVFWVLGPIALAGALGMVLSKNAVCGSLPLWNKAPRGVGLGNSVSMPLAKVAEYTSDVCV